MPPHPHSGLDSQVRGLQGEPHRDLGWGACIRDVLDTPWPSSETGSAVTKRITQPQHVTSGRRSQVEWHAPPGKAAGSRASRASPRASMWTRPAGSAASGLGEWWAAPGPISGFPGVRVGARQRAGGPSTARPVASLPRPGFLQSRGRHVVGLRPAPRSPGGRDRLRNRFAVGGLTTKQARRRRLPSRSPGIRPRPPLVLRGRRGARCDVREARRARSGWSGCPGCGRARGRCGLPRPPRGGSRVGLGEAAAHDAEGASGAPEAPELGPWQSWRRRAETSGPGFLPPRRGGADSQGRGPISSPRPNPGPRPRPLLAGADAAAGPSFRGVGRSRPALRCTRPLPRGPILFSQSWFSSLAMVGAECQVSRIPVRQSSPSHERPVGGCSESAALIKPKLGNVTIWVQRYWLLGYTGSTERAVISWTRVKVDCFYNSFWRRLHVYSEWVNRGWNADGCAFCKKMMYLDLLILCVIVEWLLMASMLHLRLVLIRNIFDIILCDRN